jgi:quinol monooxygenase YgiN
VARILARHVSATRAEPGCISFSAYRDADDPDRFALHEEYANERAFQEHRQSAHFARYIEAGIVPLLRDREWRRYQEIPVS